MGRRQGIRFRFVAAEEDEAQGEDATSLIAPESDRLMWQEYAKADPAGFRAALVGAFLGEAQLHDSQQRTLDVLDAGNSAFAIMGTGRGKSLIFHTMPLSRPCSR